MEFLVMSRSEAAKYSSELTKRTLIISITDVGSSHNDFALNKNIVDILHLQFDDVEIPDKNCISPADAEQIVKFVNAHLDETQCILVHCEAGICRSAGVAAALMLILIGNDDGIFKNAKYCPNRSCYRLVLDAYYGGYENDAIADKFKQNIKLWLDSHLN